MATIRLTPSTYYLSSSYLSISSASNMYTNTDSTTYATITNSRTRTTSYYTYIRGFNFDDVPDDAIINSFTIKFKARESGVSTSTSYRPYICNGTTTLTCSCNTVSTTATTLTFTGITSDWETIKDYGSNFGIRLNCRRANKDTTSYMYIYGAEILVDYTLPVYHTITSSVSGGTIDPEGSVTLLEGSFYELTISGGTPTVTDNGTDVTSLLTQTSEVVDVIVPTSNTNSNFTLSNISNAYDTADSDNYAQLQLAAGGTVGTIYLNMPSFTLPSGATLVDVGCMATLQYNRNNSSSGFTSSCQLYSGNTAKGSATSFVTAGGTDVVKTTFDLTVGTWAANELSNIRFYLTATNNASGTTRYIYIYGVSVKIVYESDGVVYKYTISNVTSDHTIVVTIATQQQKSYIKQNGSWIQCSKVYKKINGSWVEQTNLSNVFDNSINYILDNN